MAFRNRQRALAEPRPVPQKASQHPCLLRFKGTRRVEHPSHNSLDSSWDVPVATSRGVCTVHPSRPSYVPTRAHRRPMPCAAHVPPRRPPPSAHRRLLQSSAVRRLSGSAELSPRGSCRRACTFRRSWRGSSRTTTCAACASPPRTGRATTRWPR